MATAGDRSEVAFDFFFCLLQHLFIITYMTAVRIIEGQERSGEYHESIAIFSSPLSPNGDARRRRYDQRIRAVGQP